MRKAVLSLILVGLFLATAGCSSSNSSGSSTGSNSASDSITVSASIKNVINQYFTEYFAAEGTLIYSRMSSDILADTENTQLNEAFREMELARKKFFSESITNDYQYEINYQKCSTSGDEITVALTLNLNFHYSNAPGVDSAIGGVSYSFTLKNNGSDLVITEIDSDLEAFVAFKEQLQETLEQDSNLSQTEAIEQVRKNKRNQLQEMQSNRSLYLNGAPTATSATLSTSTSTTSSDSTETDSTINKSIYVSCREYTYDPDCVAAYAAKYWNGNSKFYTYTLDCTNFVSQCVWAGYVGYGDECSTSEVSTYISNKAGMVYPDWYATTATTTSTWAGVKAFFEYMVTSKTVGPNATTDFPTDYDTKHEYTTVSASSINVGDVIQLWYNDDYGDGDYGHSIIITQKTGNSYSHIFYSSHTYARNNVALTYAIDSSSKYMRRFTPAATCYLKTY